MKGRIKTYKEEKGYGFIIAEDQNDYFFHISEVKSMVQVQVGQIVEFVPTTNEKGHVAKNILIDDKSQVVKSNSKIFELQGKRYKVSNIKEYGISEEYLLCDEIIKTKNVDPSTIKGFWNSLNYYAGYGNTVSTATGIFKVCQDSWGRYITTNSGDSKNSKMFKVRYLYITTYQGDNTKFYERSTKIYDFKDGINLEKEIARLDELFNS